MYKWTMLLPGLALGVLVGAFSGLLGIGGGVFMVPAMIYFWPQSIPEPKIAVATSLAVMIPSTIAGTLKNHLVYQSVEWRLAAVLALGAILGTYFLGTTLANLLPGDTLKKIFGVMLLVMGLQMIGAGGWIARLLVR